MNKQRRSSLLLTCVLALVACGGDDDPKVDAAVDARPDGREVGPEAPREVGAEVPDGRPGFDDGPPDVSDVGVEHSDEVSLPPDGGDAPADSPIDSPPDAGPEVADVPWPDLPGGDWRISAWSEKALNLPVGHTASWFCPPGGPATYSVWGTDYYTADSSICTAAVHVGLITETAGGVVTFEVTAGRPQYLGSTRGGVASGNWAAYTTSFRFPAVPPHTDAGIGDSARGLTIGWNVAVSGLDLGQQVTYRCLPGTTGSLWGTDIYTGDSSICAAAVHAGRSPASGGVDFIVEVLGAQTSFTGSVRNGQTSSSYGPYAKSFQFVAGP